MEKHSNSRRSRAWLAGLLLLAAPAWAQDPALTPAATLKPFAAESELLAWFEPFAAERRRQEEARRQREEEARKRQEEARRKWEAENPGKTWMPAPPAPTASYAPAPAPAPAAAKAAESITNTQTAGVDEGGIVKAHGKHLVILRRGRLFTVDVSRGQLTPVAAVDAYGPEVAGEGGWYDEMLVEGDNVVVIGYSYARGGTELVLFRIDAGGKLAYRGTWHLKSQDYYSSRNYASRLVHGKLVLYTPITISSWHADPLARLPALRRWQQGVTPADFRPITPPTRIYRTDEPLAANQYSVTLHAVVTCDLAQADLRCESSGVLGAAGRVFYVSSSAVYVWTMQQPGPAPHAPVPRAALFRLPLDGAAPSALEVEGSPIDQFSFLEQPDGHLNVLVGARGSGDGMWRGEAGRGELSLLRVRVRDFGDGSGAAPVEAYRALPRAGQGPLQNRYVGGHLLYGTGTGWDRSRLTHTELQAVDLRRGSVHSVALPHGVDRIEALGTGAVAIGSDGSDLHFSSVRLGTQPALAGRYTLANAAQGESRSHGFFYKPGNRVSGVVGLPVEGRRVGADQRLWGAPAAMVYLYNDNLRLSPLGALPAHDNVGRNDQCRASCVDWYGNARPIFLDGRMFALMGYEIVEGQLRRGPGGVQQVTELRRISFAPGSGDYQP